MKTEAILNQRKRRKILEMAMRCVVEYAPYIMIISKTPKLANNNFSDQKNRYGEINRNNIH